MRTSFYTTLHRSLAPLMMAPEGEDSQSGPAGEELPPGVERVMGGDTLRAVANREELEAAAKDGDPDALPEGFTSWKAYADHLKANPGEKPAEGAQEETPEAKAAREASEGEAAKAAREAAVQEALTEWPEDQREKAKPFVDAFAETGTLTDEQVAEAARAFNLPESAVRQYMAGATAATTASEAEAAAQVAEAIKPFNALFGGEDKYAAFQAWGAEGLTDAEKEAFNEALDNSPKAALTLAEGFKARFLAQGGGDHRDITEQAGAEEGKQTDVYATTEEMLRDQGSPLYRTSEDFRQKVYAKLARSNI